MAYDGIYNVGTVSVAAGGTAVTGVGTAWTYGAQRLVAGDTLAVGGVSLPILAVGDDTHLTLAYPSTVTASGAAYAAILDSGSRTTAGTAATRLQSYLAAAARIEAGVNMYLCAGVLGNTPPASPALDALYVVGTAATGAWAGRANQMAQWGGAAWIFTAPADGDVVLNNGLDFYIWSAAAGSWTYRPITTVVERGTGVGQTSDAAVKIGWDAVSALRATVATSDLGKIWTDHLCASGSNYYRLPNGKMIQWGGITFSGSDGVATFPVAFPNTAESVVAVPYIGDIVPNVFIGVNIQDVTQTGFSFHTRYVLDGGTVGQHSNSPAYYVAIGW
ncbi:MAG TPA: DUF2793 domain-containing protein [Xanthobacteraceae bacterium]|nr:MAG: hypothetical protein B7Y61_01255 [Rhizobiales bacterium 35-66-30]OZB11864.1 MAG: hypothetical protein B7X67_02205 [Rhizobiales bacterium 39-66-18]HQS08710.1 DUF2793 domain-containing protein [Xanthobacteraceae bacterium]